MLRAKIGALLATLTFIGVALVGTAAPASAKYSSYIIGGWTATFSECISLGERYRSSGIAKSYICTWDSEYGLYFMYYKS